MNLDNFSNAIVSAEIPKIVPRELPKTSDAELKALYGEVYSLWETNLKKLGVSEPSAPTKFNKKRGIIQYIQEGIALCVLYKYLGLEVSKNQLTLFYNLRSDRSTNDLQVMRHLGRGHGWNIKQTGTGYILINLTESHPAFCARRRLESITDWEGIKTYWGNRCALCGAEEGKPHWKPCFQNITVRLEKGHCDPTKLLDDTNVIPQCQCCNKTLKDRFIFDKENGLPKSINNGHTP